MNLAQVRGVSGLGQEAVAAEMGVSQPAISKLETRHAQGELSPSIGTLARYAEAIGAELAVAFYFPDGSRVYLDVG